LHKYIIFACEVICTKFWILIEVPMRNLTVQDKILIHLLRFRKAADEYVAPAEVSQYHIARALGIGRGNIPYAVRRLKEKGLVEEKLAHVEGEARRMKVYFPTSQGIAMGKQLVERTRRETVKVADGDVTRESTLGALASETGISLITLHRAFSNSETVTKADLKLLGSQEAGLIRMLPPLPPIRWYYGREDIEQEIMARIREEGTSAIVAYGIAGIGKTTLARHMVENGLAERNVWWWKLHEWDTPRTILLSLSEFLKTAGKPKTHGYVSTQPLLDVNESIRILAGDITSLRPVIIFDDYHTASMETVQLFKALLECSRTASLTLLFLGRERKVFYDRRDVLIHRRVSEFEISSLTRKNTLKFLDGLKVPPEKRETMADVTKGHPLSIELIKMMNGKTLRPNIDVVRFFHEEIISMLAPEEKSALQCLSVYRAPVPLEALGDVEMKVLLDLENKAVIKLIEGSLYALHDTLQDTTYHSMTRQQSGKWHALAAEYYNGDAYLGVRGEELSPDDEADLIECLYHMINADMVDEALVIIENCGEEMLDRGYLQDFMLLLENLGNRRSNIAQEPRLMKLKGDILSVWGEWNDALALYDSALSLTEDEMTVARIRKKIGDVHEHLGQWEDSIREYEEAIKVFEKLGAKREIAEVMRVMGIIDRKRGEYGRAHDHLFSSLDIFKQLGDVKGLSHVCNTIGVYYGDRGDLKKAQEYLFMGLEYSKATGEKKMMSALYNNIGETFKLEKEYSKAHEYCNMALELKNELGHRPGIAIALNNVGECQLLMGSTDEGVTNLEESLKLAREVSDSYLEGIILKNLGLAHKADDRARCRSLLNQSLAIFSSLGASEDVKEVEGLMESLDE